MGNSISAQEREFQSSLDALVQENDRLPLASTFLSRPHNARNRNRPYVCSFNRSLLLLMLPPSHTASPLALVLFRILVAAQRSPRLLPLCNLLLLLLTAQSTSPHTVPQAHPVSPPPLPLEFRLPPLPARSQLLQHLQQLPQLPLVCMRSQRCLCRRPQRARGNVTPLRCYVRWPRPPLSARAGRSASIR